jgi:hypothetical protein
MEIINCELDIQIDGKINKIDVRELTRIDPTKISNHISECASNISFYGLLHSKSKSIADRQEWLVKKTKSQVDLEIRACHKGKVTQAQIEAVVDTDERVIAAYEEYFRVRANEQVLYSFLMALIAQKDLLVTLSANMRAEQKMDNAQ